MSLYGHTYDDSCLLQAESNQLTRRASEVSMDPPKVRAQFFYSSPLPIDDPLTPVPPPSGSSATGSLKVPSRPFSVCDNIALEEAWQIIQRSRLKKRTSHEHTSALAIDRGSGHDNLNKHSSVAEHMTDTIKDAETQGIPKPEFEGNPEQGDNEDDPKVSVAEAYTKPVLVNAERSNKSPRSPGDPHLTMCNDPDHTPLDDIVPIGSDEIDNDEFKSGMSRRRHRSPSHRRNKTDEPSLKRDITPPRRSPRQHGSTGNTAYGSSPSERDTTGTPFLRVSSRLRRSRSGASRRSRTNLKTSQTDGTESANEEEWTRNSWPRNRLPENAFKRSEIGDSESDHPSKSTAAHRSSSGHRESDPQIAYITVGVSRLHVVELPNLKVGGFPLLLSN